MRKWNFYLITLLPALILISGCHNSIINNNKNGIYIQSFKNENSNTTKVRKINEEILVEKDVITYSFSLESKKDKTIQYKFPIVDKCRGYLNLDSVQYSMNRIAERLFHVGKNGIKVYKFYYDELNSWDEETVILFSDKLGILYTHHYWGSTTKLIQHPNIKHKFLKELQIEIESDKAFYKNWEPCGYTKGSNM